MDAARKCGAKALTQASAWYHEARKAEWRSPQDIREKYKDADFIGDETVVFNICWNRYRLVARVWFPGQEIYVKFFGTHAEYDRLDMEDLRNASL
jgi:mRNA interferase HigB